MERNRIVHITNECTCNFINSEVIVSNETFNLKPRDNKVLECLVINSGLFLDKDQILNYIDPAQEKYTGDRTISDAISNLRKIPVIGACIETRTNTGYGFTFPHKRKDADNRLGVPCSEVQSQIVTLQLVKDLLFGTTVCWDSFFSGSVIPEKQRVLWPFSTDDREFLDAILPEPVVQSIGTSITKLNDEINTVMLGLLTDIIRYEVAKGFTVDNGYRFGELRRKTRLLLQAPADLSAFLYNVSLLLDHLEITTNAVRFRECCQRCIGSGNMSAVLSCLIFFALVGDEIFGQIINSENDYVHFTGA